MQGSGRKAPLAPGCASRPPPGTMHTALPLWQPVWQPWPSEGTMWVCLAALSSGSKAGETVQLTLCAFYHNELFTFKGKRCSAKKLIKPVAH